MKSKAIKLNSKNQKIYNAIFHEPIRANVLWADIIVLFKACGAKVVDGKGSRVRIKLNGVMATFHEPHPQPTTDKGALKSVREFLENAKVKL